MCTASDLLIMRESKSFIYTCYQSRRVIVVKREYWYVVLIFQKHSFPPEIERAFSTLESIFWLKDTMRLQITVGEHTSIHIIKENSVCRVLLKSVFSFSFSSVLVMESLNPIQCWKLHSHKWMNGKCFVQNVQPMHTYIKRVV